MSHPVATSPASHRGERGALPRDAGVAVWAPLASRVGLVFGDRRVRLHALPGGWWRTDVAVVPGTDYVYVPPARPGQRYGYRVHGPWEPTRGDRFNPAKVVLR